MKRQNVKTSKRQNGSFALACHRIPAARPAHDPRDGDAAARVIDILTFRRFDVLTFGRSVRAMTLLAVIATIAALTPSALAEDAFAIRAGRIIPVADDLPREIENGVIIIRDGRIAEIGRDITIPLGMRTVDLPDATIMPGMVAAMTDLAGDHQGNESIAAGYRAVDAFDRYQSFSSVLEGGVTTVHVNPGRHRLLSGRGAVVRLGGEAGSRVLRADTDLTINLGEPAFGPPMIREQLVPPASDQAITPDQPQRPTSRMSQMLALNEAVESAQREGGNFDFHRSELAAALENDTPLRVHVHRAHDVLAAISFMDAHQRQGYLVGGAEAAKVVDRIARAKVPLVYTLPVSFRQPGTDIGVDPTAIEPDVRDLVNLGELKLAIAMEPGESLADLRLVAALARRSLLDEHRIIEAITRVPAEILGVADRVGSLAPGRDADLVVLTDRPLATSSHVQRVYVQGKLVYRARPWSGDSRDSRGSDGGVGDALIVRAGTIWLGPNDYLHDGSVLIERGRIVEVGKRVSHPPHARVIDGGADGFLAPGMIDARGHLGLRGDRSGLSPQITLARLIGLPDEPERRVARAGVTTVMMTPYSLAGAGSQVSAVRTLGRTREDRVIRATAAVAFDLSGADPATVAGRLRPRLDAARRYLEAWQKYEKELEEWKQKQAEGVEVEAEPVTVEEQVEEAAVDPLSGVWAVTVSGGPMPEAVSGRVAIRLRGNQFEGQVIEPPAAQEVEHSIVGTLEGDSLRGRIEVDTGGMGTPMIEATLGDETVTGEISFMGMAVDLNGERVETGAAAAVITRRRRVRDEEGRPVPPPIDESLEPLRAVLEKKIPLMIEVETAAQVRGVLDALTGDHDVPFMLVGADEAAVYAEQLRERGIGVVLRPRVIRTVNRERRHAGVEFARMGIVFAFQSGAEDGARTLPQVGLFAVERGLSGERALAAMTIDAARLFMLEDRIGSIAPGRDADLVLYSGHPFEAGTMIRRVIVNGEDIQP
jgi:imidazolonepropionase-like amidohydrolase